jgi:hypothetical protein
MKLHILLLLLAVLLIPGCSKPPGGTNNSPSTPLPALPEEVRSVAVQRGKAIAMETFSLLSSNRQTAIQQGGVSNALPFCSLAASLLTAGMAGKHGVTLRRATHKPRNPAGRADSIELGERPQIPLVHQLLRNLLQKS